MRSIVPTFAPASLILAVTLLGGVALAAEPAPKPPDTATIGRVPPPATNPSRVVTTPLRPIAPAPARAQLARRAKPVARASTALPAPPAALDALQRAKLAGATNATSRVAPAAGGKLQEQSTQAPPVKGAPAVVKAPPSTVAPTPGMPARRGEKPHEIVTVGRAPAGAATPAAPQVQKTSEAANARPHARKAAELSTTRPRDASAPKREKQAAPDSTKRGERP
jgi:hypothetical protein